MVGGILDIRNLYQLREDSMMILYVGNVSQKNNQGQLMCHLAFFRNIGRENICVVSLRGSMKTTFRGCQINKYK